eukprot:m.149834 g.149834  ORF g.149834 m.149834 type:complete len:71 (-) comp16163_c6_seq1:1978-2190(-)
MKEEKGRKDEGRGKDERRKRKEEEEEEEAEEEEEEEIVYGRRDGDGPCQVVCRPDDAAGRGELRWQPQHL